MRGLPQHKQIIMVEIREVKTRKEQKEFIEFPLKLYKDNPCFVPPLYGDEKKMFKKNFVYNDMCETICFNAYKDGKIVGRISGIEQKTSNKIRNEKRIRFNKFDCIEDFEVAEKLFSAVEQWSLSRGMDTVCGPLGYSDLEREGLLVEGFDQLSTFEEQYNAEYYKDFIEKLGYTKEIDWTESKIRPKKDDDGSLQKMADFVMKRYNLHLGTAKNTNDFLKRYADQFFDLLDSSYKDIYGSVPFTDGMKKMMISNFKLIIDLNHIVVVLNEKEEMVCLGLCFPSLAKALRGTNGKLTPINIIKLLRAIKHPDIVDLGLIGVDSRYINTGINTVVCAGMMKILEDPNIQYAETNLNLEDNYSIQNMWKRFDREMHKRRRSYVKVIGGKNND